MELIKALCEEEEIRTLGINEKSSLGLVKWMRKIRKTKGFEVFIERFDGKKISLTIPQNDCGSSIWKSLKYSHLLKNRPINWKTIKRKYDLAYNDQVILDNESFEKLGLFEGCVLKFHRKKRV